MNERALTALWVRHHCHASKYWNPTVASSFPKMVHNGNKDGCGAIELSKDVIQERRRQSREPKSGTINVGIFGAQWTLTYM